MRDYFAWSAPMSMSWKGRIVLLRGFLFFFLGALCTPAAAMDFSIERIDVRPIRQPTIHVTATGAIESGDTEKLKAAFDTVDKSDVRDVLFMFDSPGGALMESLEMGDFISDLPAIVSAQVGSQDIPDAECASACVYAYIAADYRYMSEGAKIGIHRFGVYDVEMDGNEGAALGQAVSGILSEYIRSHRVEPEFFEAISLMDHNDILWVPTQELERWRVVTNNVYDEQQAYININGKIALRIKQIAITGDSYLTIFCTDSGVAGLADLHEPELATYGDFEVLVGDIWYSIPKWDVLDRSDMRGKIVFDMPFRVAQAALYNDKIGARVVAPGGDIFFGFQQIVRNDVLQEMVRGCPGTSRPTASTMMEMPGTDLPGYDLTTEGIRGISFARCKSICLQHKDCRAVSYVQSKSWCWPKKNMGQRRNASGIISAYKN